MVLKEIDCDDVNWINLAMIDNICGSCGHGTFGCNKRRRNSRLFETSSTSVSFLTIVLDEVNYLI